MRQRRAGTALQLLGRDVGLHILLNFRSLFPPLPSHLTVEHERGRMAEFKSIKQTVSLSSLKETDAHPDTLTTSADDIGDVSESGQSLAITTRSIITHNDEQANSDNCLVYSRKQ